MPPLHPTVPAPLTTLLLVSVIVPAPKFSAAPFVTLKPPSLDPPLFKLNVPTCACTVPLLLHAAWIVDVPLPALFLNVPALFNTGAAPPRLFAHRSSLCISINPPP